MINRVVSYKLLQSEQYPVKVVTQFTFREKRDVNGLGSDLTRLPTVIEHLDGQNFESQPAFFN